MTLLLVVVGGAIGAPLRYLTDLWVQARHDSVLPRGTLSVNVIGSFALGVLAAVVFRHAVSDWVYTVVGTGLCGALTTFSTFGYETVRLALEGSRAAALLNVAVNLVGAYAACAFGWWVGGLA